MSMIVCPECGQVAAAQANCPACGHSLAGAQPVREYPAPAAREAPAPYAPPPYAPPSAWSGPSPYAAVAAPDPLAEARSSVQLGYIMLAAAFAFGPLWLVAGIMGYTRRDAVRGTWLESHCNWLVDTLLVGAAGLVLGIVAMLFAMILFFPFGIMGMIAFGFGMVGWHVYRLVRGWTLLAQGKPAEGLISPPRW